MHLYAAVRRATGVYVSTVPLLSDALLRLLPSDSDNVAAARGTLTRRRKTLTGVAEREALVQQPERETSRGSSEIEAEDVVMTSESCSLASWGRAS